MIRRPPRSPPFPYTPLSRSEHRPAAGHRVARRKPRARAVLPGAPLPGPVVGGVAGGVLGRRAVPVRGVTAGLDRKSTRLNSSHANISYAVFCLKKKKISFPP